MSVMRFENSGSHFEMGVATENASVQSRGDAYVTVDIFSSGFAGRNDLWVLGEALLAFCASLVALEKSLKGEALLDSISPNELRLRVFSVNNRGLLAVEGSTGYMAQGPEGAFWNSVAFGFNFEPQQLTKALTLPWLRA